MFAQIFNYIEHLFTLIKPKKLFYMAIDGVAPRAKMNQQRSRRFRSALDAEHQREKALEKGLEVPKDPFDSNAITPGTEFMAKLSVHLKYFIHKKVSTDSSWQNIEIILSGHEVPGEGEHKIMSHIRIAKSQPDYEPNLRHCLYGLDADLIMLGLLTHDTHFAILREEVLFLPSHNKQKELAEQNFYLLHLSLVREYLELEFDGIEEEMKFTYNFERILDDFILLNFFIGNDFLPELPSLLINDGALPFVIKSYSNYLKEGKDYITKNGIINFNNLADWIEKLSLFEYRLFETGAVDLEWINKDIDSVSMKGKEKAAKSKVLEMTEYQKGLIKDISQFVLQANSTLKPDPESESLPSMTLDEDEYDEIDDDDIAVLREFCSKTYIRVVVDQGRISLVLDVDGIPDNETDRDRSERLLNVNKIIRVYINAKTISAHEEVENREEIYDSKFIEWKNEYYNEKFGYTLQDNPEKIRDVCENYLEGLQWVLLYYFRGIASWGWYFRYYYAPKISDIKLGLTKVLKEGKINFNLGHPLRPFEQLMAVLPEKSKALVPPGLRPLMVEENSPIKEFYPAKFELDKNGKKADWEAVVKIPFVDEKRLLAAIHSREQYLTPEEKHRNTLGNDLDFVFNPQVDTIFPSSLPGIFLDVEHDHTIESVYHEPAVQGGEFRYGLCDGAKLGVNSLAGFPSLKTLPFTFEIDKGKVKIFERPARRESIIITITDQYAESESSAISKRLLGRTVYVGWPYLREAKVVALSDELFSYKLEHGRVSQTPHHSLKEWTGGVASFLDYFQIKGVDIGKSNFILHVMTLKGLEREPSGAYVKKYESDPSLEVRVPLQLVVESVQNDDERFIEKPAQPIEEEYPIGSQAVSLLDVCYGLPVTVIGYKDGALDVEVRVLNQKLSQVGHFLWRNELHYLDYQPGYRFSKQLRMPSSFIGQLTSRYFVFVDGKKVDIGLNLKSENLRQKALGFVKRGAQGWDYSVLTKKLIEEYVGTFSLIFAKLLNNQRRDMPELTELLGLGPSEVNFKVDQMKQWLKDHVFNNPNVRLVSLEDDGMGFMSVQELENRVIQRNSVKYQYTVNTIRSVPREALFAPDSPSFILSKQKFEIGDQVVSILDYGKVPLFSRGTVISIKSYVSHVTLDVIFDSEIDSGNHLNNRLKTRRGLTVESSSILNLSNPQLAVSLEYKGNSRNTKGNFAKNGVSAVSLPSGPKAAQNNSVRNGKAPITKPGVKLSTPKQPKSNERGTQPPKPQNVPKAAKPTFDTTALNNELLGLIKNNAENAKAAKDDHASPIVSSDDVNKDIGNELLEMIKGPKSAKGQSKSREATQNKVRSAIMGQFSGGSQLPPQPNISSHILYPPPPPPPGGIFPPIPAGFVAPGEMHPGFVPMGYPPPPPPGAYPMHPIPMHPDMLPPGPPGSSPFAAPFVPQGMPPAPPSIGNVPQGIPQGPRYGNRGGRGGGRGGRRSMNPLNGDGLEGGDSLPSPPVPRRGGRGGRGRGGRGGRGGHHVPKDEGTPSQTSKEMPTKPETPSE